MKRRWRQQVVNCVHGRKISFLNFEIINVSPQMFSSKDEKRIYFIFFCLVFRLLFCVCSLTHKYTWREAEKIVQNYFIWFDLSVVSYLLLMASNKINIECQFHARPNAITIFHFTSSCSSLGSSCFSRSIDCDRRRSKMRRHNSVYGCVTHRIESEQGHLLLTTFFFLSFVFVWTSISFALLVPLDSHSV